jgi:hypothetical protein
MAPKEEGEEKVFTKELEFLVFLLLYPTPKVDTERLTEKDYL